ncbi:surfeit locus protein 6 [Prunus yedoensis var. nudiflora]|uniref:Surfeit locus protein 6 n=2 Tax=Prunus TaxID=3754 RepID=A0A314XLF0_PRUYE|nr:surfeit locus protein 6 [Prunus yedoensis var. nudiflora]
MEAGYAALLHKNLVSASYLHRITLPVSKSLSSTPIPLENPLSFVSYQHHLPLLKMKKKRASHAIHSKPVLDLKSIIHQNSQFFDKLVELIPARFYLPIDDDEKPWFQGLSKSAKASAKKESKENIKKARRQRLDPEKSSTTTLDLLKQSLEKKSSDESDSDEIEVKPVVAGLEDDDRSVTYEELQHRLRCKIEEFRAGRHCEGSERARKRIERHERYEKKGADPKKRKRETASDGKKSTSDDSVMKDAAEASKELTFSHVKLGNEDELGKKNKKRKLSKLQELERAKQLEEAKKDPEKGEIIAKKHSWKAATSRAAGIKVHDDPKLLKQSLHKEKKKHQKNAEKWKGRVETTEKMKADKQKKRSDNISQKKQEKKMRKIAKREKKLMRPGFEGRKEGFITQG